MRVNARGSECNEMTDVINEVTDVINDKRKENRGTLRRDHWSR
jgi:hypothetical protein